MADHVFPEDQGTNDSLTDAGEGDDADAANFASAHESPNDVDYVLRGLEFTPDFANNTLDISAGKARLSAPSAGAAQTSETRDQHVAYTAEPDQRIGLVLNSNATNYVYLSVLLDGDDDLEYVVNTTGDQPPAPSLYVGYVSTANDNAEEVNRKPAAEFESASVDSSPSADTDVARKAEIDSVESQLFSGSYSDLVDVPSVFTPEEHDNSRHSTNYLAESDYDPEGDTHDRYSDDEARSAVSNSTLPGSINLEASNIGGTGININTANQDYDLWHIAQGNYGWRLFYNGADSSNNNSLELYSENNGRAWYINQNGYFYHEGNVYEHGNRVATRSWTDNNADVPNADHADSADSLNGDNVTTVNGETGDVAVDEGVSEAEAIEHIIRWT